MTKEQFGTATTLYHNRKYNVRHQLYDLRVGTDGGNDWTWNRGAIAFYYNAAETYGGSGPDNNGNVRRMDHWAPITDDVSQWHATYQRFTYDGLNRLQQAREDANGYNEASDLWWVQQFDYDRWGNRQINQAATKSWTLSGGNKVEIQTEVNEKQFQILTGNNRLKAPADTNDGNENNDQMRYDPAGNLIRDEYTSPTNPTREFLFDSGGRIGITRDNGGTELARYVYDTDGARVRRIIRNGPGSYDETWLVYGIGGELVAEYANNVGAATPQKEYGYRGGELLIVTNNGRRTWLVQDHLGSTRMVIDESGSLSGIKRRDYLPFGEELAATVGHRAAGGSGYAVDDKPRQKFTGHERDGETGLDFMQARYYSSLQGRFTSTDPIALMASRLKDPRRINLYAYVRNNPLSLVDPDGEDTIETKVEEYSFTIEKEGKDKKGRTWRFSVKVTVTERTVTRKDDDGKLIQTHTDATAKAENTDRALNSLSESQLQTVGQVASTIAEVAANSSNFDRSAGFAIATRETFFGTDQSRSNSSYNPMQLTRDQFRDRGLQPSPDLRDNVFLSFLLLEQKGGSFQAYGPGAGNAGGSNYGRDVTAKYNGINAQIGGSIRTTNFFPRYDCCSRKAPQGKRIMK